MLKRVTKNFNKKDKKNTMGFLMKHGLTEREARKYTELNAEFDVKSLTQAQKELLENNF